MLYYVQAHANVARNSKRILVGRTCTGEVNFYGHTEQRKKRPLEAVSDNRNSINPYKTVNGYEKTCAEAATNAVNPAMAAMPEAPTRTG